MVDLADRRASDAMEDSARARRQVPRWVITTASISLMLLAWEFFGRDINPIFGSYPTAIFGAFIDLARSGKLATALFESVQPFLVGYILAIVIGVPLGLV